MATCTDCNKEFNSPEGLQHHREAKHGAAKSFMMKKKYYWYAGSVAVILLLGSMIYYVAGMPGKYDGLAKCLSDKGVMFYGAFWCPHCQEQKQLFGKSAKLLPYVECSTPDGKGQTPICLSKSIEGYPTWDFPDGSRLGAVMTPQDLAQKSGCSIDS